jgi:Hypothetical glycosyl hydrolase family 15
MRHACTLAGQLQRRIARRLRRFVTFPGGKMLLDPIRKGTLIAAATFALAASTTSFAWNPPNFPRVGGVQIGSPFNYQDPTYEANLAKQSIMVLADYPTMAPGGMSMQQAVSNIKAKNPNALVFTYVNANQLRSDQALGTTSWGPYRATINSMKWWLYSDKSLTQFVNSGFGTAGDNAINMTLFTPKDSSGNTAIDWMTRFFVNTYSKPAPAIDGFFMDNVFWRPYIDGDWNRDGVVDSQTNPTVQTWFRQGYARYFSLVKTLMPGKYQLGNIGDWGNPSSTLTEYQGMVNGGVLEAFIGKSWSVETWAGWANMLAQYRKVMSASAAPKLVIFNQWGSSTDYQGMRYGLGTCLLDDGYYSFTENKAGYYGVVWFDELDQTLGAAQAPPAAAWQKGVWRRDFDNGIVLVNPKGNGPQTVTLETSYLKIKGTQDPVTNSGQSVTTVTLKDRDGIILLRPNPVARPATPTGFSVEH